MPDSRPIGVFDSGVGGLTVARAILDLLPFEPIVYVGDTARFVPVVRSNRRRMSRRAATKPNWRCWGRNTNRLTQSR